MDAGVDDSWQRDGGSGVRDHELGGGERGCGSATGIRQHLQIEKGRHYVRDETLGENACRVRTKAALQVLATLRNAVIHLLAGVEGESRPAATEYLQTRPEEAKKLIGLS